MKFPALAIDDSLRLEQLGYRLATSNATTCRQPQMLTGLMLSDISGYAAKDRPAIRKSSGLGQGFLVRKIVSGSVADLAGFLPKDEIVAVDNRDMTAFAAELMSGNGSFARTERFVDHLDTALRSGPAKVTVRRGDALVELALTGAPGCGGRFTMVPGSSLNAWADGRYVAVTTRMMRFAADDSELAFVVAHEMSHNILGHDDGAESTSGLFGMLGIGVGKIKADEIAADTYAVGLVAAAGYDLGAPERFLRHAGKVRWMDVPTTHPGTSRRIALVNTEIARRAQRSTATPQLALAVSEPAIWRIAVPSAALWHPTTGGLFAWPKLDHGKPLPQPALAAATRPARVVSLKFEFAAPTLPIAMLQPSAKSGLCPLTGDHLWAEAAKAPFASAG